jgi:hypothetical protein
MQLVVSIGRCKDLKSRNSEGPSILTIWPMSLGVIVLKIVTMAPMAISVVLVMIMSTRVLPEALWWSWRQYLPNWCRWGWSSRRNWRGWPCQCMICLSATWLVVNFNLYCYFCLYCCKFWTLIVICGSEGGGASEPKELPQLCTEYTRRYEFLGFAWVHLKWYRITRFQLPLPRYGV